MDARAKDSMHRSIASISLDLDNKWSYLKTHGDDAWSVLPSYLDLVVPRILEFLDQRRIKITVFVVGQDAALPTNRTALESIAQAGHEIGNHSFHHEPWLHEYSRQQLIDELAASEAAIFQATGQRPVGFRGPGFSVSDEVICVLAERLSLRRNAIPYVFGSAGSGLLFSSLQFKSTAAEPAQSSVWEDARRLSSATAFRMEFARTSTGRNPGDYHAATQAADPSELFALSFEIFPVVGPKLFLAIN